MAFNKRFAALHIRDQGGDWSQFEREFLEAHNTYRSQHGVPPLTLSKSLCTTAQVWAEQLLTLRSLKHSGDDHGENLFYKYSSSAREIPGHEAVDSWYSEIKNYDFNNPGFRGDTGHFTQVVWKDTKECGVGVVTDGRGLFFVVGQYNPAGNITNPGYFEQNVLPPLTPSATDTINGSSKKPQEGSQTRIKNDWEKTPAVGASRELSQFEQEFLEAHNFFRKQHGSPPLQLSRKLSVSAQQWADNLKSIRALQHSGTEDGENLFYKYSSSTKDMSGKEPVESWYSEIKNYDFGRPGFKSNTGHFTQVVWKDSKEVGVGIATDGRGLYFIVGQYSPAGNITNAGYFEKNVLPPGATYTNDMENGGRLKSSGQDLEPSRSRGDRGKSRGGEKGHFELEVLETHNVYRQQHGAPPLHMSTELTESSQNWADHLLAINALQHSNTTYGENIWYKWNSNVRDASGKEIVDTWYGEIKDYNFSKPGFQSNTGHFTQVVWKDSKEMGIGKAVDGKGMVIAVAQYSPAGNITNTGYFQRNVLPRGTTVSNDQGAAGPPYPVCPREAKAKATGNGQQSGYDEFLTDFLNASNSFRMCHGAKPLTLNPNISHEAQKWAEHLLSLKTLKHSETTYGENVWAKTGGPSTTLTGQEVADAWYKEEKNYDYSNAGHQPDTGHFTQMVWRSSKEVGVGMASSGRGMFIVVAQYNPTGNITNPGYYKCNVMPPGSKITDDDEEEAFPSSVPVLNATSAVSEKESSAFIKELLSEHNMYRSLHRAGPLQISTPLCMEAQAWANHLMSIRALQNSDTKYGENLWYRWGTDTSIPTGKEVADSWYNEIVKYNFNTPGFQNGAGNFTQMVWKSSTHAGFGVGTDSRGMYIVVGFYDPPGNISNMGYFEENVLPKRK